MSSILYSTLHNSLQKPLTVLASIEKAFRKAVNPDSVKFAHSS